MNPREVVAGALRLHPRVAYQELCDELCRTRLAEGLPLLTPFGGEAYCGVIAILDWDHRLPSKRLVLRVYAFTSNDTLSRGERSYESRVEEIANRDKFPEFDVPDFDCLISDEAYECDVMLDGTMGRFRLTSSWRRDVAEADSETAIEIARRSEEFKRIRAETTGRPAHLGDLEAVGWCPPCESDQPTWTIDVWYLTAFDGQVGKGRSLLVDLPARRVAATREFTVRTG